MKPSGIFRAGWLVTLLLMAVLLVVPIRAQELGFTETFDDPVLPGWEHSPNVAVVDSVLRIEPGNFAFHDGEWGDLTLTVRVRRFGEGALVVSYRTSDAPAPRLWPSQLRRPRSSQPRRQRQRAAGASAEAWRLYRWGWWAWSGSTAAGGES